MRRGTFVLVVLLYPAAFIHVNGENSHIRHRRSWIMPGTLWCGAGSIAENFTNLGIFHGVDLCCREHDHCSPYIQAFEYKYGIRNYKLHTITHCDCDQRFRQCLRAINDTMSTLVGIMFFNILEMPCFTLREAEQCVEWHWWGGCKRNGSSLKAELQMPMSFNYTEDNKTLPQPQGSPLHKGKIKPSSFSLSSINTVKSKNRLLKKLERTQTNESVKGNGGMPEDSRGDTEVAEKKRRHGSQHSNKRNFRRRRQWTRERNGRTTKVQNSTISNSKVPWLDLPTGETIVSRGSYTYY